MSLSCLNINIENITLTRGVSIKTIMGINTKDVKERCCI